MDDLKKYHQIDQEQINKLNQQLSDYESEINMLRRTISSLETERARDKDRINKLQEEVDRLRIVSFGNVQCKNSKRNRKRYLELVKLAM